MFVAMEALPGGHGLARKLLTVGLSPTVTTYLAESARACQSSVTAAASVPGADSWRAALLCLRDADAFIRALTTVATEQGAMELLARIPHVGLILGVHAVDRIVAEWLPLGPPRTLTFTYRLRCGSDGPCATRADPVVTTPTLVPPDPQIVPTPTRTPDPATVAPQVPITVPTVDPVLPTDPTTGPQPGGSGRLGPQITLTRMFVRDASGTEVASPRCVGSQIQLAALIQNPASAPVHVSVHVGVKDLQLQLYHHIDDFSLDAAPGPVGFSNPWVPERWVNGSMRYEISLDWDGGSASATLPFTVAFDPSCAQG